MVCFRRRGPLAWAICGSLLATAVGSPLPAAAIASSWTTDHFDAARSGNDTSDPALGGSVTTSWTSPTLDGLIYGEPLHLNGVVYVATQKNSLYALDATNGHILWSLLVILPSVPLSEVRSETGVANGCGNIDPLGITGTPVIDPSLGAAGTLFAVAETYTSGVAKSIEHRLIKVDLGSHATATRNIDPVAPGFADGSTRGLEQQRSALNLAGGEVVVPYGGLIGDCGIYHGFAVSSLENLTGAANTFEVDPNYTRGGIWASSGAAVDASGNVYVSTGNGNEPANAYDLSDGVIKLPPTMGQPPDTAHYFAPDVWKADNNADLDLGSDGPILIPRAGPNPLVFATGKQNIGFLLDSGNLGGIGGQLFPPLASEATTGHVCDGMAFGGNAYANGYLYMPCREGVRALTVDVSAPSFTRAWIGPSDATGPLVLAGGRVWLHGSNKLYGLNAASGAIEVNLSGVSTPYNFGSPSAGGGRLFFAAGTAVMAFLGSLTAGPNPSTVVSTQQYTLSNNDGSSWATVDPTNLATSVTPNGNSTAILGANVDLFTNTTGYNQDIAIFASDNGGVDQLLAWKESGGFAGTFSPNAAFVQSVYSMAAGHTYTFKLKWKTNKPEAAGVIIYAGAGGIAPYSPTRLTAEVLPAGPNPYSVVSTQQYALSNNNGSTWATMDATNLVKSVTPSLDSTAILGGNADLWTASAGYNQDLGIFVSDNGGADQLVAWKESGGFAGTFSPNAVFVQGAYAMTAGHTYTFTLKWKTNKPEPGGVIIYAAAGGPAPYSPTRLTAQVLPAGANPYTAMSTQQYTLSNNDGSTWTLIDSTNLVRNVTPSVDSTAILGGNADLWTASAGYNQDLGIFVSDNGGADQLVAWKESGGYAGTFSPNAVFVQSVYPMTANHTYTFSLKWKTNKPEPSGVVIYAAAGAGTPYSPTRLTAQIAG